MPEPSGTRIPGHWVDEFGKLRPEYDLGESVEDVALSWEKEYPEKTHEELERTKYEHVEPVGHLVRKKEPLRKKEPAPYEYSAMESWALMEEEWTRDHPAVTERIADMPVSPAPKHTAVHAPTGAGEITEGKVHWTGNKFACFCNCYDSELGNDLDCCNHLKMFFEMGLDRTYELWKALPSHGRMLFLPVALGVEVGCKMVNLEGVTGQNRYYEIELVDDHTISSLMVPGESLQKFVRVVRDFYKSPAAARHEDTGVSLYDSIRERLYAREQIHCPAGSHSRRDNVELVKRVRQLCQYMLGIGTGQLVGQAWTRPDIEPVLDEVALENVISICTTKMCSMCAERTIDLKDVSADLIPTFSPSEATRALKAERAKRSSLEEMKRRAILPEGSMTGSGHVSYDMTSDGKYISRRTDSSGFTSGTVARGETAFKFDITGA